jgi:hypothetical protein
VLRVRARPHDVFFGQAHDGWVRGLTLAVLLALCALVPLAYASPPDPAWIGGIYDAADSDDQVLAAMSLDSQVEEELLVVRSVRVIADVRLVVNPAIRSSNLRRSQPRAPPNS